VIGGMMELIMRLDENGLLGIIEVWTWSIEVVDLCSWIHLCIHSNDEISRGWVVWQINSVLFSLANNSPEHYEISSGTFYCWISPALHVYGLCGGFSSSGTCHSSQFNQNMYILSCSHPFSV
jgi:hypothetical protein